MRRDRGEEARRHLHARILRGLRRSALRQRRRRDRPRRASRGSGHAGGALPLEKSCQGRFSADGVTSRKFVPDTIFHGCPLGSPASCEVHGRCDAGCDGARAVVRLRVLQPLDRARLAGRVTGGAVGRHVCGLRPGGKGWLAGLSDRFVGRGLAVVHGRPSEPWTVERLGRQVGLSRSALAERFSQVMGEPIFTFLTRWRLQVAAEYLLTTPRSVESIAHEAGYESAGAFSAAFKRVFGKPPSVWRKRSRRAR